VKLEEDDMVDPLNDTDVFCFLVITGRLTDFAAVHSNQAQSTAHNCTNATIPCQLQVIAISES